MTWGRRFEGFTSGDVKGVAGRNRRREFDNSAVCARRQEVHVRPSTIALLRIADRAIKAASRAYAGEATRSALSARPRTAQSGATADEETVQIARAFGDFAGRIEEIVYSG